MPGTTPGGWPYALPADARVDWPATSQQLANKLEQESAGFDWIPFSPALTNAVASQMDAAYMRTREGLLIASVGFTVTSVSGDIYLAMPVAASKTAVTNAYMKDANGGSYVGAAILVATSTLVHVYAQDTSATHSRVALTSSTVPFTWAAGDTVAFTLTYQCAPL